MGWRALSSKSSELTTLLTQPNIKQVQQHKTYNLVRRLMLLTIQHQQVQLSVCLQSSILLNCHQDLKKKNTWDSCLLSLVSSLVTVSFLFFSSSVNIFFGLFVVMVSLEAAPVLVVQTLQLPGGQPANRAVLYLWYSAVTGCFWETP